MTRPWRADGFSLAEMLVTIVLFGLVGGAIATVVTVTLRHQADIQNRNDALSQARTALQRIDRNVRAAVGIAGGLATTAGATSNSVTLRQCMDAIDDSGATAAYRDVTYQISGSNLVESSTDSDGTKRGPVTVARNVVNTSSQMLFTYVGSNLITATVSLKPPALHEPVYLSDGGTAIRNLTLTGQCQGLT